MTIRIYNARIGDENFRFICSFKNYHDGFGHNVSLECNGTFLAKGHARYWNRTWERYAFQTCMYASLNNWEDAVLHECKTAYKNLVGKKRVSDANVDYMKYKHDYYGEELSKIAELKKILENENSMSVDYVRY